MPEPNRFTEDCPLFVTTPGVCGLASCQKSLTGRNRRWCSDDHRNAFGRQHFPSWARSDVLERDRYACQSPGCGVAWIPPPMRSEFEQAIGQWWERDRWVKAWQKVAPLEVNHIIPIRGQRHRGNSCLNHQSNLETLCRDCHRVTSRLQIASTRQHKPRGPGKYRRTIACWEGLHDRCWSNAPPGRLIGPGGIAGLVLASCTCECHLVQGGRMASRPRVSERFRGN